MKVTIESTSRKIDASGVPCRVWEGETERGVKIICLIARVAVKDDQDVSQFEAELQETRAPSADALSFPLRMIL
jgi:hypothetical protein